MIDREKDRKRGGEIEREILGREGDRVRKKKISLREREKGEERGRWGNVGRKR